LAAAGRPELGEVDRDRFIAPIEEAVGEVGTVGGEDDVVAVGYRVEAQVAGVLSGGEYGVGVHVLKQTPAARRERAGV